MSDVLLDTDIYPQRLLKSKMLMVKNHKHEIGCLIKSMLGRPQSLTPDFFFFFFLNFFLIFPGRSDVVFFATLTDANGSHFHVAGTFFRLNLEYKQHRCCAHCCMGDTTIRTWHFVNYFWQSFWSRWISNSSKDEN
jgi:hypothetical protein